MQFVDTEFFVGHPSEYPSGGLGTGQPNPPGLIQAGSASILLGPSSNIYFSAIHSNSNIDIVGVSSTYSLGNFAFLGINFVSAANALTIDTTELQSPALPGVGVSSGVTDTLNVNYNDGFVWLGGVDLSAKATETIHVRDSANINFSTGTDNSLKSITVYAINTQNDFTLNSLSASGSHSYIGGFPAVDGFLNVGRDFLLSAEASNLSLESNSISVSGATTFLLNNSDVHFGASSVVSHGVFELKSTGSNASVGISQLTAGKSGWSIYMGTSNTSRLTLDDFKFSGGGTLDIHLSHFSISAKSTQKGGQVDVTFNFNDALINNAFRPQELAYETKDARDFVTIQNFTFTSSPTLKVSGAGNHEKISVDPTAAASILNAAINTKLTADDLFVHQVLGVIPDYIRIMEIVIFLVFRMVTLRLKKERWSSSSHQMNL